MFIDYGSGCRQLEEALKMALDEAMPVQAGNAMLNPGAASGELMHLAMAERWLREAISFCGERELDMVVHYTSAWLALCELHTGRWVERQSAPATSSPATARRRSAG